MDNFAGVRLVIDAADRKVDLGARIEQGVEYCAKDKLRREQSANEQDLSHGPEEACSANRIRRRIQVSSS